MLCWTLKISSSMALQPGVDLGLLYNTPPSLSILCSVSPFIYSHLSQVRGHVIQPSHFWSSSSSCCIQLSIQHLLLDCVVLHSFYMTKPPYSLAFNPLKPELNPICYFLALLGAHRFLHVSRIRVKLLTLRWLMSYIYIYIWSTHSWCF